MEGHRRRQRKRARKRAAFSSNTFGFVKQLLGDKRSGHLSCSPEEVDQFLRNTLNDPQRDQMLGPQKALIEPPPPEVEFDLRELSLKEVQEVVEGARSVSTPERSIHCLQEMSRTPSALVESSEVIWRRKRVTDKRRCAEGVWIPKEESLKSIDQFHC